MDSIRYITSLSYICFLIPLVPWCLSAFQRSLCFVFVLIFYSVQYVEQNLAGYKLGLLSLRITFTVRVNYTYRHLTISTAGDGHLNLCTG